MAKMMYSHHWLDMTRRPFLPFSKSKLKIPILKIVCFVVVSISSLKSLFQTNGSYRHKCQGEIKHGELGNGNHGLTIKLHGNSNLILSNAIFPVRFSQPRHCLGASLDGAVCSEAQHG